MSLLPLSLTELLRADKKDKSQHSRARQLLGGQHHIEFVLMKGAVQRFVLKEAGSASSANLEVLAQEIFRLFLPYQPVARVVKADVTVVHYVLTEEVQGFTPMSSWRQRISSAELSQLGVILPLVLFLQEIDFNELGLGFDAHKRLVKLDGGWCFAHIRDGERFHIDKYPITEKLLAQLPHVDPLSYPVSNWLDVIITGQPMGEDTSKLDVGSFAGDQAFYDTLYLTCFRLLITPPFFLDQMIDAFFSDSTAGVLSRFLQMRQSELIASLIQLEADDNTPSFSDFLTRWGAAGLLTKAARSWYNDLTQFKVSGVQPVVLPGDKLLLQTEIVRRAKDLKTSFDVQQRHTASDDDATILAKRTSAVKRFFTPSSLPSDVSPSKEQTTQRSSKSPVSSRGRRT